MRFFVCLDKEEIKIRIVFYTLFGALGLFVVLTPHIIMGHTETNNTNTNNTNTNSNPNTCSYIVDSGDTLWSIAKKVYGDATQYQKIIDLNKDKYTDIESKLSIGQELTFCDNNQNSQTTGNNSNIDNSNQQNQTQPKLQPQASTFHWWNPFTWF